MQFNVNEIDMGLLVNNMSDMIFFLDLNKRLLSFNTRGKQFLKIIGSDDPQPGDQLLSHFSADKKDYLTRQLDQLEKENTFSFEDSFNTDSGLYHLDISLYALTNKAGEQSGFCLLLRDTTDKKLLADERNAKRQHLTEAIIAARETERSEIGRELHDNVTQILGAARLYISSALVKGQPLKPELLEAASDHILSAIEEIRKLSKNLQAPVLYSLGLECAVRNLAEDITRSQTLTIWVNAECFDESPFNDKFKLNAFRIIQEQLNNIIRHASANSVNILLASTREEIRIQIADDGKGFNTSKLVKGLGLFNIESRVELYKGRMGIISSPGGGCRLQVIFPYKIATIRQRDEDATPL